MTRTTLIIILLCALIAQIEPGRILAVVPFPSISHQVVFRPLTQELARRGHDVVVLTADPAFPKGGTPPNLTEIDMHEVSYARWRQTLRESVTVNTPGVVSQITTFFEGMAAFFEIQMDIPEVKEFINKTRGDFDLLIIEGCVRPSMAFSHVYKVPMISLSTFGFMFNEEYVGAPYHPILYPSLWQRRSYNLTNWEKVSWFYQMWRLKSNFLELEKSEDKMLQRKFGADIPPLSELAKNVDMIFLNYHPIWNGNRPVPPGVIHVGGLHQKPQQELPQDLKSYLDSSKNGVIYVSFGTNVLPSSMPPKSMMVLLNVLSRLRYDVLLKWADELPIEAENIRHSKWFPQADILRHPNIKLFINQGGLQSTDEALTGGVPLIGIPFLGDQWYNTEKYVHLGIGKQLNLHTLTEEDLTNDIETVITDKSYREKVMKLRALIQDQPQTSVERAVWWVEHLMRHGGGHLRSPAANMPLREYLELDLILIVLAVMLVALAVLGLVLHNVYKFVFQAKNLKAKTL